MPYANRAASRRNCSRRRTPSSARGSCRWPSISDHRRERRRSAARHSRHRRVLRAPAASASTGGAICTSRRARRSTRSTTPARGLNEGSKVVIAAAGPTRCELADRTAARCCRCPTASATRASCLPGVLAVEGPACPKPSFDYDESVAHASRRDEVAGAMRASASDLDAAHPINAFPLIVLVDDSEFAARVAQQLPLGDVHALEPRRRHPRHRRVHQRKALGLPRLAGHRRPHQAAPRPAARRRPRRHPPRRCPRRPRRAAARDYLSRPVARLHSLHSLRLALCERSCSASLTQRRKDAKSETQRSSISRSAAVVANLRVTFRRRTGYL